MLLIPSTRRDQSSKDTHPNGEVTFALSHSLLVSLPLMRSAGLWHVGGLLPPQALAKLVHLRARVLPGTVDTETDTLVWLWSTDCSSGRRVASAS